MPATNYNTAIRMCHLPPCQPQTTTQLSECVTYHHASHTLQHRYQHESLTSMPATNYNTAISMCHLPPCQPHTTTYFSMCHLLQCVTYPTTTYFSVSVTPQLLTSVCHLPHNYILQCVTYPTTTYLSMCHLPHKYFSVSLTPQLLTSVCHLPHNYLLQCVSLTTMPSHTTTPLSACATYHHASHTLDTAISMCHSPPCRPHTTQLLTSVVQ